MLPTLSFATAVAPEPLSKHVLAVSDKCWGFVPLPGLAFLMMRDASAEEHISAGGLATRSDAGQAIRLPMLGAPSS